LLGAIPYLPPLFLIWKDPKIDSSMYQKDLFKDWSTLHFIKCKWYLDCPKDYIPSFEVSLCENFEPRFIEKYIETHVSQGPKKSKDATKKKGEEKFATAEIMVDIERLHDDF
jgi:hypothetical protein